MNLAILVSLVDLINLVTLLNLMILLNLVILVNMVILVNLMILVNLVILYQICLDIINFRIFGYQNQCQICFPKLFLNHEALTMAAAIEDWVRAEF